MLFFLKRLMYAVTQQTDRKVESCWLFDYYYLFFQTLFKELLVFYRSFDCGWTLFFIFDRYSSFFCSSIVEQMVLFRVCDSRRSQETRETFQQHLKISFVFSESDSGGFWYIDSRQEINNPVVLIVIKNKKDCLVGRLHSLAVERHLVNVVCEIGMEEDKQMFSCEDVDSRKTRLNTSIRLMLCMSRPIVWMKYVDRMQQQMWLTHTNPISCSSSSSSVSLFAELPSPKQKWNALTCTCVLYTVIYIDIYISKPQYYPQNCVPRNVREKAAARYCQPTILC